jgi:hypothetical protein
MELSSACSLPELPRGLCRRRRMGAGAVTAPSPSASMSSSRCRGRGKVAGRGHGRLLHWFRGRLFWGLLFRGLRFLAADNAKRNYYENRNKCKNILHASHLPSFEIFGAPGSALMNWMIRHLVAHFLSWSFRGLSCYLMLRTKQLLLTMADRRE